jgi:ribosomal protein L4
MPKKAWNKALCLAISDRARQGKLFVVEGLELPEPKTKAAKAALDQLGLKHALIVLGEGEERQAGPRNRHRFHPSGPPRSPTRS